MSAHADPIDPTEASVETCEQLIRWEDAIRQQRDRIEPGQTLVCLLQQGDRRDADADNVMVQLRPEQRKVRAITDHGNYHHVEALPKHGAVKRRMEGVVLVLPVLDRLDELRSTMLPHVDAAVGETVLAPTLPAWSQATGQSQQGSPAIETGLQHRYYNNVKQGERGSSHRIP